MQDFQRVIDIFQALDVMNTGLVTFNVFRFYFYCVMNEQLDNTMRTIIQVITVSKMIENGEIVDFTSNKLNQKPSDITDVDALNQLQARATDAYEGRHQAELFESEMSKQSQISRKDSITGLHSSTPMTAEYLANVRHLLRVQTDDILEDAKEDAKTRNKP